MGNELKDNSVIGVKKDKKSSNIVIIILIALVILSFIGGFFVGKFTSKDSSNQNESNLTTKLSGDEKLSTTTKRVTTTTKKQSNTIGLNETFEFDDLEITIGSDFIYKKVDNRFSEYNGQEAIGIPITVKNLKDETHSLNMFYYDVYGSAGTQAEKVGSYFDNDVNYAGDLRTGASYTKYIYVLYDGDGLYSIEFDNYSSKKIVEFNLKK